eukprot:scaffold38481_cov84-Phaeocystis_antarctica.AAC.4
MPVAESRSSIAASRAPASSAAEVLPRRERRPEDVLARHIDARARVHCPRERPAVERDRARRRAGPLGKVERVEQHGFARTRRPDDGKHLALCDGGARTGEHTLRRPLGRTERVLGCDLVADVREGEGGPARVSTRAAHSCRWRAFLRLGGSGVGRGGGNRSRRLACGCRGNSRAVPAHRRCGGRRVGLLAAHHLGEQHDLHHVEETAERAEGDDDAEVARVVPLVTEDSELQRERVEDLVTRPTVAHGARGIARRGAVEALLAADDGRAVVVRHEFTRRAEKRAIVVPLSVVDGEDVGLQ